MLFERPRPYRQTQDLASVAADPSEHDLVRLGGFQGELVSWHDMSFVSFHPSAVCEIPGDFYTAAPTLEQFYGSEALITSEVLGSAEDALRFMVEDCDYLSEFLFLTDAASNFGALTGMLIERIVADEYPKAAARVVANFATCQDFAFAAEQPPRPLVATALASLSKLSTQFVPVLLEPRPAQHAMFEESLVLDRAVDASILVGATLDTLFTGNLIGRPSYTDGLLDLKLATPLHQLRPDMVFTALGTLKASPVVDWSSRTHVKRINHTEQSYPASLTHEDLPVYAPNLVFEGYTQQASSACLLLDPAAADTAAYVRDVLLKGLRRQDFLQVDDAGDRFSQVKEDLHRLCDADE